MNLGAWIIFFGGMTSASLLWSAEVPPAPAPSPSPLLEKVLLDDGTDPDNALLAEARKEFPGILFETRDLYPETSDLKRALSLIRKFREPLQRLGAAIQSIEILSSLEDQPLTAQYDSHRHTLTLQADIGPTKFKRFLKNLKERLKIEKTLGVKIRMRTLYSSTDDIQRGIEVLGQVWRDLYSRRDRISEIVFTDDALSPHASYNRESGVFSLDLFGGDLERVEKTLQSIDQQADSPAAE